MIIEIVMPKMGESITEGTILEWRKKVGEHVEKDELVLEIGTDKVDSEIPCVESGTLCLSFQLNKLIHNYLLS
jgi:2-oxoglutarate dehydrogenase E2 component (dihydrolipoamide succinyltransferase)